MHRVLPIKFRDSLLRVVLGMVILGVLRDVLVTFYPISCAGNPRGMKLVRVLIRVFVIRMAGGVRSRRVLMVMVLKVILAILIKASMRVIRAMAIILEEGTVPIIVIAGPTETLISLGIGTISVPAVGLMALVLIGMQGLIMVLVWGHRMICLRLLRR
jgi:hypothetical protein